MTDTGLTTEQERLLNGDALHMAIFRRMEAMIENPDDLGIFHTTEFMAGLKADLIEQIQEVAYQAAGAASVPFMRDHPEYVMPTEEITEGVETVLRDLCPSAAKENE